MSHFARLRFAFMLTVVLVGIIMIADMIFAFHVEDLLFTAMVVVPIFIGAYLLAPLISKHIPYKE
jgi:hypothetical protein